MYAFRGRIWQKDSEFFKGMIGAIERPLNVS